MMDYYGSMPAPSIDGILLDISYDVKKQIHEKKLSISKIDDVIEKHVKNIIDEMGGHDSLGSYAGYCVFIRKDIIDKTVTRMNEQPKMKYTFKIVARIVYNLIKLHNTILDKIYRPHGVGYVEAQQNFHNNVVNEDLSKHSKKSLLPPIGKKPLYTPVKDYIVLS